jgi:hypothetical protein
MLLKVPVLGSLVRMLAVARFSRTLATLLKSGVPLLTAMDIVKNVVTNSVLADVIDKARDAIREGESIATPLIEAHAGDPVRIHVFGASNEQNGMFSVEKHEWPIEPFMRGADQISVVEYSGSETIDAYLPSAGGMYRLPGDYVYSNQRLPYSQSGQWGYVRVLPSGDTRLLPLTGAGAGAKSAEVEQPAAQAIPVASK